jgi:hypothetical protein
VRRRGGGCSMRGAASTASTFALRGEGRGEPRASAQLGVAQTPTVQVKGRRPTDLVFASDSGAVLDPDNLAERVLAPACEEAGVEWAGFHTFRHKRWLGHHSPSFTLDTYVHLLDADLGVPLEASGVNAGSTQRPATATSRDQVGDAESRGVERKRPLPASNRNRGVGLITRRSRVRIPPPLLTKGPQRRAFLREGPGAKGAPWCQCGANLPGRCAGTVLARLSMGWMRTRCILQRPSTVGTGSRRA